MLRWIDIIKFSKYGNPELAAKVEKTDEEWRQLLTEGQFRITRQKGTEKPYSGRFCRSYEPGKYACICCKTLLFDSYDKYNSLSGWPSFTQPIAKAAIKYELDLSFGMKRIEAQCNTCDSHLGHVFPDGPEPAGLRFCINSESLFRVEDNTEIAVLGAGCFWSVEAVFQSLNGVINVEPGYSGGKGFNPTYREVASGLTGHAEMVRVTFDPEIITYRNLLETFFAIHNPRSIDPESKSFTQYRSIILYYNEEQRRIAEEITEGIRRGSEKPVYTEIAPLKAFYKAEDKHQNYYLKNPEAPYCTNVIQPKLEEFKRLLKEKH